MRQSSVTMELCLLLGFYKSDMTAFSGGIIVLRILVLKDWMKAGRGAANKVVYVYVFDI